MRQHTTVREVAGPWSLSTSRNFWEGFTPAALRGQDQTADLKTVFLTESDWSWAAVTVRQEGATARITVTGDGNLDAAAAQTARFLALDIDGRGWPAVGDRDAIIGAAQLQLPGLRPCGFHSPYEAAAWTVLSQRTRITQAARLRDQLIRRHGHDGAFPAPAQLRTIDLDLPGCKPEYLRALADAALDGILDGSRLRDLDPQDAIRQVQQIHGLGPFAAELVVLRGANHPDGIPHHEARLAAEITEQYGPTATLTDVAQTWRPYRTWAAVHLRALREHRTHEISAASSTNTDTQPDQNGKNVFDRLTIGAVDRNVSRMTPMTTAIRSNYNALPVGITGTVSCIPLLAWSVAFFFGLKHAGQVV